MKSIEYVNRYGKGIFDNDPKAVADMLNMLISECNSQIKHRRVTDKVEQKKVINEFNRKGNVIAELFERTYGRAVLKKDWFRNCVAEARKGSGEAE